MIRTAFRSALLVLVLALAPAAKAGEAEDKAMFAMRYDELHQATDAHDQTAMEAIFAAEFVAIDLKDGKSRRDKLIAAIMAAPKDPSRKGETTVLSAKVEGDKATVVQRFHLNMKQPDKTGALHDVEVITETADIWALRDGAWLLVETRTDRLQMAIDGRPVVNKSRTPAP